MASIMRRCYRTSPVDGNAVCSMVQTVLVASISYC